MSNTPMTIPQGCPMHPMYPVVPKPKLPPTKFTLICESCGYLVEFNNLEEASREEEAHRIQRPDCIDPKKSPPDPIRIFCNLAS